MPKARKPFKTPELRTERLRLRGFRTDDLSAYTGFRKDPLFVRYLPGGEALLSHAEEVSRSRIKEFREGWKRGFGVFAVELLETAALIGQAGLTKTQREAEVELLYALAPSNWGKGYAQEAAKACLDFGFNQINLKRIVAFAVAENTASTRVMEAIGMRFIGEDNYNSFNVVRYEIARETWRERADEHD